jgi:hypothetical protein
LGNNRLAAIAVNPQTDCLLVKLQKKGRFIVANQSNSQVVSALKKEIARTKEQKRELYDLVCKNALKYDFPVNEGVQNLLDESYTHRHGHPVLNSIAFDNYPSQSFDTFAEAMTKINPEFGDRLAIEGIDFWVIAHNQTYSQSGYTETSDFGIDTEGWMLFQPELDQDDKIADQIREAVDQFQSDLIDEIYQYLDENSIDFDEINQYIAEDDLLSIAVKIKEIDGNLIYLQNHQQLIIRSEDETNWEFINSNRGQLIGISQILNPEMLPKKWRCDKIFAVY